MRQATLTALNESIKTWERRAAGEDILPNQYNCPLCHHFGELERHFGWKCEIEATGERCPVFKTSHRRKCSRTPYAAFDKEYQKGISSNPGRLKKLAQAEVDFLKSLLPDEKE